MADRDGLSSEERLRRLQDIHREEAEASEARSSLRRFLFGLVALLVVVAVAGATWVTFGVLAGGPGAEEGGSAAEQGLREWYTAWYLDRRAEDLAPPSDDDTPVDFEVFEGEAMSSVASRLESQTLVRDGDLFLSLVRDRGLDTQVQAGRHVLRGDMSAEEVLEELLIARADELTLTIPEGLRVEEVAALIGATDLGSREEVLALVAPEEGPAGGALGLPPAAQDRPEGASLEGFLFPDTYQLDPEAGVEPALQTMLDTFEARVGPDFAALAEAQGLTPYEAVVLASIVQRETVLPAEAPQIARVFLNRLDTPPYLLNADPTVQYALGFQVEEETWWKRPLLTVDTEIDSPYNTYRVGGLPPGPIANPGLSAIEAVLRPAEGTWQYFVANEEACDGSHVFADTLEEHSANIAQYQTGGCGGEEE